VGIRGGDQKNDQRCPVLLRALTAILSSGKGNDTDEITLLRGHLVMKAALHGMLGKVRDLALPLLALSREVVSSTGRKP